MSSKTKRNSETPPDSPAKRVKNSRSDKGLKNISKSHQSNGEEFEGSEVYTERRLSSKVKLDTRPTDRSAHQERSEQLHVTVDQDDQQQSAGVKEMTDSQ